MNVFWTQTAQENLDSIYEYISRGSVDYALRIVDRITRRSIQIREYPYSGRKVPEYNHENLREVIEGPYRIIYTVSMDEIRVLAFIHGASNILSES